MNPPPHFRTFLAPTGQARPSAHLSLRFGASLGAPTQLLEELFGQLRHREAAGRQRRLATGAGGEADAVGRRCGADVRGTQNAEPKGEVLEVLLVPDTYHWSPREFFG